MMIKIQNWIATTILIPSTLLGIGIFPSLDAPNLSALASDNRTYQPEVVTPLAEALPAAKEELPPPFGANLFIGGYETIRDSGSNPDYRVTKGDQISLWLWGAINVSSILTVDNQGNIFLPEVGPVQVEGVPSSQLQSLIQQKIQTVYVKSVEVYVDVLTETPVSVFVTGPVLRPGQYAGFNEDSVLSFLKRAGGIDSERGSYRHIDVLRDNETIASVDLYDFLIDGKLADIEFQDKDVIVVRRQGPTVVVEGSVRNPFRFEFYDQLATGKELIYYARPLKSVSHVAVAGNRGEVPVSFYIPIKEFHPLSVLDGDKVRFEEDLDALTVDISVEGSYLGPSYYTVEKNTRLYELLDHVAIDPEEADTCAIYIKRKSVAREQKRILNELLDKLERKALTTPASSTGDVLIKSKEATMIMQYVNRARGVKPEGRVVVAAEGKIANIRLEQGDVVVIPEQSDLVHVGGEVLMPQTVVHNDLACIEDYVAWAGGYTQRADYKKVAIIHPNGMVSFDPREPIYPGDKILVMPQLKSSDMQLMKELIQVAYQVAVSARIILD